MFRMSKQYFENEVTKKQVDHALIYAFSLHTQFFINLSIYLSINQSTNQSINQSINLSIYQKIHYF